MITCYLPWLASAQLWQGQNDATVITLLKEEHSGVEIRRRKKSSLVAVSESTSGFGASMATQNNSCYVCSKRVYQNELVAASDKAFHKNCFRYVE